MDWKWKYVDMENPWKIHEFPPISVLLFPCEITPRTQRIWLPAARPCRCSHCRCRHLCPGQRWFQWPPRLGSLPSWITGWWFQHLQKIWVRQLGLLFPMYGKIVQMFQTTNQIIMGSIVPYNHLPTGIGKNKCWTLILIYWNSERSPTNRNLKKRSSEKLGTSIGNIGLRVGIWIPKDWDNNHQQWGYHPKKEISSPRDDFLWLKKSDHFESEVVDQLHLIFLGNNKCWYLLVQGGVPVRQLSYS